MTDRLTPLETLASAAPSTRRDARIRRRAHEALRRQAARESCRSQIPTRRSGVLTPLWFAAAASLGVAWLSEVLVLAARVLTSR